MAKSIAFGLNFVIPLMIVRFMTVDEVGHYRALFQIIGNATIILSFGVSMSSYYFLNREVENRGKTVLNILVFNFLVGGLAAAFFVFFPSAIGTVTKSPEIQNLSILVGIVIWLWLLAGFIETIALANSDAPKASTTIITLSICKTLLTLGAVLVFSNLESMVYAALLFGIVQVILLFKYLFKEFPGFWREFELSYFIRQLSYSAPFGLAGILWLAQTDVHNYFVMYNFTAADMAIYAYGCFQIPLITMLAESVSSVLIPHMNTLQRTGDRHEMVRLTVRAMEKLSFFYFPLYVFLMITASTFITTLFTNNYKAATSIFMINLTILPFQVLLTDPIVRSFKELGRVFLLTRIFVLTLLVGVLYFWLDSLGLVGIIAVAVGALLLEKFIGEFMIVRKLGITWSDLPLLRNVGKTAVISIFAGAVTFLVYSNVHVYLQQLGEYMAEETLHTQQMSTLNFFGGSLTLLISGLVFAPIYLLAANFWGVIEENEKAVVRKYLRRVLPKGWVQTVADSQG